MNADLIKRERIREALTARLLQLSKQCEEICSPTPGSLNINESVSNETKSNSKSYEMGVFKLHFPDPTESASASEAHLPPSGKKNLENMLIKSDKILPIMINNFVAPNLAGHSFSIENREKAFSKDYLDTDSALDNRTSNFSVDAEQAIQSEILDVQSDCESRLFITTPSTDLDHYMNTSDNSILSPSELSHSTTTSDGTSVSEADHITVVSLTSDTESQDSLKLYENYAQLQSQNEDVFLLTSGMTETLPKVLNELPVPDKYSADEQDLGENTASELPNSKTPRRRRLSYTLETPSPVLEKALRNSSVGPDTTKQKSVSKTTKDNNNIHCQIKPSQLFRDSKVMATKDACLERPTTVRGSFSSSKSRIPVMNSVKSNITSALTGYEQHVSALDHKNQSLRQYLEKLNSSVTPLTSPKHEEPRSSRIEYSNSPPLTPLASRSSPLSAELSSLRDEISQQRELLVEQSENLKDMVQKQESFFQRMLSAQYQQMAQLQKELSREVHELFAQHSLAVQARLQNLEASIMALEEDRRPLMLDRHCIVNNRSTYPGTQEVDGMSRNQTVSPVHEENSLFNTSQNVLPVPHNENAQLRTVDVDSDHGLVLHSKVVSSYTKLVNLDRISAAVKGYLTRRLLKTEKVQGLIQTIRDTMECALNLHEITRTNVTVTRDDAELHQRLINQVTSACHAFHDVFFKYSVDERMHLIAQSRQLAKEKLFQNTRRVSRPYISSATIKSLERKKFAKSKSVSPNAGRMRWKEPKRSSTAMDLQRKSNMPVPRKLCVTPVKDRPAKSAQVKGDCRSPSFYT